MPWATPGSGRDGGVGTLSWDRGTSERLGAVFVRGIDWNLNLGTLGTMTQQKPLGDIPASVVRRRPRMTDD